MNDLPDPGAFARLLRLLVSRGVHRAGIIGSLTICVRAEPRRRIVFSKFVDPSGQADFNASFARDRWAEESYEPFRAELDRRGISYQETHPDGQPTLEFAFGRDAGGAYVVTKTLCEDGFRVRLHQDCVGFFRNVVRRNTPNLTSVDAPDEGGDSRC
jgi:hypothetical protein